MLQTCLSMRRFINVHQWTPSAVPQLLWGQMKSHTSHLNTEMFVTLHILTVCAHVLVSVCIWSNLATEWTHWLLPMSWPLSHVHADDWSHWRSQVMMSRGTVSSELQSLSHSTETESSILCSTLWLVTQILLAVHSVTATGAQKLPSLTIKLIFPW